MRKPCGSHGDPRKPWSTPGAARLRAGVVRTTKQQPAQEPQACGLPGLGPHAAGAGGGALGKVLNSSVPQGPSQPHGNELVQVRHSILLEEQPGS